MNCRLAHLSLFHVLRAFIGYSQTTDDDMLKTLFSCSSRHQIYCLLGLTSTSQNALWLQEICWSFRMFFFFKLCSTFSSCRVSLSFCEYEFYFYNMYGSTQQMSSLYWVYSWFTFSLKINPLLSLSH